MLILESGEPRPVALPKGATVRHVREETRGNYRLIVREVDVETDGTFSATAIARNGYPSHLGTDRIHD